MALAFVILGVGLLLLLDQGTEEADAGGVLQLSDLPPGSKHHDKPAPPPPCPSGHFISSRSQPLLNSPQYETRYGIVQETFASFETEASAQRLLTILVSPRNQRCLAENLKRQVEALGVAAGRPRARRLPAAAGAVADDRVRVSVPATTPIIGPTTVYLDIDAASSGTHTWILAVASRGSTMPSRLRQDLLARSIARAQS